MKRTLFSCCIWLTSLAVVFFSGGIVRAESCCHTAVPNADDGDCACPYAEMESYGECHWSYNHCDPVAEIDESEVVASEEPTRCEPVEAPAQASDAAALSDDQADYWYDSESGSYYYYEFTDEATVTEETAEDALNDLFDFADAEVTEPVVNAQTEEATSDTADTDANVYGDYYGEEAAYDWDEEDGLDYSDESYIDEVFGEAETTVTEVADDAVPQVDEYDYYSEYEDDGWEYDEPSYCPEDEVPAVDTAQDVTAAEPTEEANGDSAWQDSIVEDPWHDDYDYSYEDQEYEYRYGDEYNYDTEVTEETQWDTADEPVAEQVAEDTWEDEYYSDYEDYYSEYDDTWADDDQTAETEEAVEPVAEDGEVVESWEDEQYDYYDDEYEYGYDSEYWENQAADAPAVEAENHVATVGDEDTNELPREAVLSLAHTLDRFGSALQNLSRQLTDMVAEEVAEGPAAETTQR